MLPDEAGRIDRLYLEHRHVSEIADRSFMASVSCLSSVSHQKWMEHSRPLSECSIEWTEDDASESSLEPCRGLRTGLVSAGQQARIQTALVRRGKATRHVLGYQRTKSQRCQTILVGVEMHPQDQLGMIFSSLEDHHWQPRNSEGEMYMQTNIECM